MVATTLTPSRSRAHGSGCVDFDVLQKMLKAILKLVSVVLLGSCNQRSYEEGVESRLRWLFEPQPIPASCKIEGSTIDSWDEWPTYQIVVSMDDEDFRSLIEADDYRHEEFSEPRLPYEQHIELDEPFLAHGVYRRQVHDSGICSLFYSAVPRRYFILYTHRPKP